MDKKMKIKWILSSLFLFFFSVSIFYVFLNREDSELSKYCAFCDPKVLHTQKFYEDDLVYGLCTHKPIFPGHCLVIPKRHATYFEDLTREEAAQIMAVMKKVHMAVQDSYQTSSYLLLQKNGRESGQSVPHVHFHYIPRKKGDLSTLKFLFRFFWVNFSKPNGLDKTRETVEKLRSIMNGQDFLTN